MTLWQKAKQKMKTKLAEASKVRTERKKIFKEAYETELTKQIKLKAKLRARQRMFPKKIKIGGRSPLEQMIGMGSVKVPRVKTPKIKRRKRRKKR